MHTSTRKLPRISFGIIVLNGEPFTKYCLRQLYPHAHEIIVVEGGSEKAAEFAPNGRSTDGTLEALAEFCAQEDPEKKVRVVTKEGFWQEKDEQSQAYADLATGDYLWQVDIDEFYRHEDIIAVRQLLAEQPAIDAVTFKQYAFWGSPYVVADSFGQRSDGADQYHRLFKWRAGYRYRTHRPPTVVDETGTDLRQKHWVTGPEMARQDVCLYHYSLLLPIQVREKCRYYATSSSTTRRAHVPGLVKWAEANYFRLGNPFRVHNVYRHTSWLSRFTCPQPEEAMNMWQEILRGKVVTEIRDNADVEALLNLPLYRAAACALSWSATLLKIPPFRWARRLFLALGDRYSRAQWTEVKR